MSGSNSKLHPRAVYLRNLLIAHVTGRNVNESDYHKLRHYFMGLPETSDIVPSLVVEHEDLSGLWHSMRYNYASHEDRKAYVVDEFQVFLDKIAPPGSDEENSSGAGYPVINDKKLQQTWNDCLELLIKSPDTAIGQMKSLVENLCYQLLKLLKVVPDPQQHSLSALVTLTERSLLLSPGKKYHLVVHKLVASCGETLAAIDSFTLDCTKITPHASTQNKDEALVLVGLYGSLASLLLSAWRVRDLLKEGSMQR